MNLNKHTNEIVYQYPLAKQYKNIQECKHAKYTGFRGIGMPDSAAPCSRFEKCALEQADDSDVHAGIIAL